MSAQIALTLLVTPFALILIGIFAELAEFRRTAKALLGLALLSVLPLFATLVWAIWTA